MFQTSRFYHKGLWFLFGDLCSIPWETLPLRRWDRVKEEIVYKHMVIMPDHVLLTDNSSASKPLKHVFASSRNWTQYIGSLWIWFQRSKNSLLNCKCKVGREEILHSLNEKIDLIFLLFNLVKLCLNTIALNKPHSSGLISEL